MKQYADSHSGISNNHTYLLRQLVDWQRLSVHLGGQYDNVRDSYDGIREATQDEGFVGAIYGVFADKNCTKQLATLTTDENGNTDA